MYVLNNWTPALGYNVCDLIVNLVLGHRREKAESLQGGDCLIVTHGAHEGHGDPFVKRAEDRTKCRQGKKKRKIG
jgi:hypothetical protein